MHSIQIHACEYLLNARSVTQHWCKPIWAQLYAQKCTFTPTLANTYAHSYTQTHSNTGTQMCTATHSVPRTLTRTPAATHSPPNTHTLTYTHSCLPTCPVVSQHFPRTCRNWVLTVNKLNTPDPTGMYNRTSARRKPHIREEMKQGTKNILIQSTMRVSYEETQDCI